MPENKKRNNIVAFNVLFLQEKNFIIISNGCKKKGAGNIGDLN